MKKGQINLLLLDFCSINNWTTEEILNLQKKYQIVHTLAGQKRGYETYCFPKFAGGRQIFALMKDQESIDYKNHLDKNLSEKKKSFVVLPLEAESQKLWEHLKRSQKKYIGFLEKCSMGELDIGFINNLFSEFSGFKFKYVRSNIEWKPELYLGPGYFKSFESYINWEILKIFQRHKAGDIFPYIKKCFGCDRFYKAKILRPSQKYCPDCSKKSGMRTRHPDQWSDYMRAYMKKRRGQIKKSERENEIKRFMANLNLTRKKAEELWEDESTNVKC